jgi:hypothetical protein
MRTFRPSDTRQNEGDEDRYDEPPKRQRFPHTQVTPNDAIKREGHNHNQSGQETRCNERTLARARERILLRSRVDQYINVVTQ